MDPATMAMLAQMFQQGMQGMGQGAGSILGNIFNDPRKPWAEAQRAYDPWMDKAGQVYNPFYKGGIDAMGKYNAGLDKMQDPSKFINNLMGDYKESDWAKYMQDYANKAGINAGSASGMVGSTPWAQQMQANASGIASQDMQQWLQNALGANKDYLAGQADIFGKGFGAAQGMGNIFGQRAGDEAQMAYNKERAGQQRTGGIIGGILNMFGF